KGIRLGRGIGAVRGRGGRLQSPRAGPLAESGQPRAVRFAVPPRRQLLVRHVLAGRGSDRAPERVVAARDAATAPRGGHRRVAIGRASRHLRERGASARPGLRRFSDPQPWRWRGATLATPPGVPRRAIAIAPSPPPWRGPPDPLAR